MRNPRQLLTLFGMFSLLAVAFIPLLVGYGIYEIYSAQVTREAEGDAVAVGEAIFEQERDTLLAPGPAGRLHVALAEKDFEAFDGRMRRFLRLFDIYKIKVFALDKRVIYSTDRSIIGAVDSDNVKLHRVLTTGEVSSKLESKDTVQDLQGERRFEVDVVETYLPIRAGDAVIGSFEVYVDVTRARDKIYKMVGLSVAVLAFVLTAVFAGLYVPVRLGMLQLSRVQGELHASATVDTLTGTRNRGYLLGRIREEHARMARGRLRRSAVDTLGFAMMGVDNFGSIDEKYGSPAGDQVLRVVAERLKRNLRAYDVIGRYGGAEFLVLLPDATLKETRDAAARMHDAVRSAPFDANGTLIRVTVSAGIACAGDPKDEVLAAIGWAEEGLRKARGAGGDRVAWM